MGDSSGSTSNPKTPQPLHPVYTVNNIQTRVRTLDGVKFSYPAWVNLFTLHAKGFDVLDHIDGSPAPAKDSADYVSWEKIDAIVLQWIYGTLSDDLLVRVLVDKSTAHDAWERVKNYFLNNKGSRAAALQHELTNITLAAMPSVEAYCQWIRELSDQLAALDFPVNENQRVLHLVRGLPREYDTVASLLNQTLPPWEDACNRLLSEAQLITARDQAIPTPVVAAVTAPTNNRDTRPRRENHQHENHQRRPPPQRRGPPAASRTNNRNPAAQFPSSGRNRGSPSYPAPYGYGPPQPYWALPPYWAPPPCPYPTQS